jgi:hypothetical protein
MFIYTVYMTGMLVRLTLRINISVTNTLDRNVRRRSHCCSEICIEIDSYKRTSVTITFYTSKLNPYKNNLKTNGIQHFSLGPQNKSQKTHKKSIQKFHRRIQFGMCLKYDLT